MPLKSKLEIIEEIAAYYSEDTSRRGYDSERGECLYHISDTKKCAVGYCLINSKKFKYLEGTIDDALDRRSIKMENFKEEYRINDRVFWKKLQDFHDISKNWNEKGITSDGEEHLKRLRKLYAETPVT